MQAEKNSEYHDRIETAAENIPILSSKGNSLVSALTLYQTNVLYTARISVESVFSAKIIRKIDNFEYVVE